MENINEILSLDSEEKIKQVKRGEFLQREGELSTSVFYVKKGLLRSYTIDSKGKEHIFMFGSEGWIVADNVASGEKGELFIDALEDSMVIPISKISPPKSDFQKLHKRIGVLQKRIIMLMSAPAIERYNHFLEVYPDIVQRVPQKMIASYLGITPQALSTLRGAIAKGK
ncbi:MAG: CRP-like cAMP-binding protein [Sphingobacteriales bacterium]|jgi:CRP-like cAMP-binding protein